MVITTMACHHDDGVSAQLLRISLSVRKIYGSITGPVKSHNVASGSPPLRRFCVVQSLNRGDGPRHSFGDDAYTASVV